MTNRPPEVFIETLKNGLTVLGEPMPWLQSTAFTLLIPAGTVREEESLPGSAGVLQEWMQRGAGDLDSRQIVDRLDFLGVERSSSVSSLHAIFSVASLAESFEEAMSIYAKVVRQPHFPEEELDDAKAVAIQELHSAEDDPAHRCLRGMKELRYGTPYGRSSYGTLAGIEAIDGDSLTTLHHDLYGPQQAILAVAGRFDWKRLIEQVNQLFGDWTKGSHWDRPEVTVRSGVQHIPHDSQQTQIAVTYDAVPYEHAEYYQSRGLVGVLSDGMSSRLFTEVREKRGLAYHVSASSQSFPGAGNVLCFAGTTRERAQETLDVVLQTVESLGASISQSEVARLKTRIKTMLVMEQESSMARSSQIASDWYHLGRVPSRAEVAGLIEAITPDSLIDHFRRHPPTRWALVTLGGDPLELRHGI